MSKKYNEAMKWAGTPLRKAQRSSRRKMRSTPGAGIAFIVLVIVLAIVIF